MISLLRLCGSAYVAFFDFSVGAFAVFVLSRLFKVDPSVGKYLLGGILGLVPDFDVLYMYVRRGRVYDNHHELLTHRPLIMVPLLFLLAGFLGGLFWASVAATCLLLHYIHDSQGWGGGLGWLWPFSSRYYSFKGSIEKEKSRIERNKGKHNEWLAATWLTPTPQSVTEVCIGALLLGISLDDLFSWRIAVGLPFLSIVGAVGMWFCYSTVRPSPTTTR